MNFKFEVQKAELRNVNLGKEGNGDDMTTRLDLKFLFTTTSKILIPLMGVGEGHNTIFWNGERTLEGLEEAKLNAAWEHNTVIFGDFECQNATIKNVTLKPLNGQAVTVSLTCQFRDPTKEQLKQLADFAMQSGELNVISDPDLFDEEQNEESED